VCVIFVRRAQGAVPQWHRSNPQAARVEAEREHVVYRRAVIDPPSPDIVVDLRHDRLSAASAADHRHHRQETWMNRASGGAEGRLRNESIARNEKREGENWEERIAGCVIERSRSLLTLGFSLGGRATIATRTWHTPSPRTPNATRRGAETVRTVRRDRQPPYFGGIVFEVKDSNGL
jgi:hypothetical protein